MKTFDYVRPAIDRRRRRSRSRARRRLSRRRHQPARPDEGRHRPSRPSRRRHPPARARPHRAPARWRHPDRRAGSQCRSRARSRFRTSPIPPWPRRCCPAPRRSCAMPRPSAAICCSGRAARISTTPPAPATSASPAPAAMPAAARTGCTPCSAGATPASPPIRRISACRWSRSTPWWRSRAELAGARSRSRPCTACPATRRSARTSLEPGDLIVALRLPGEARAFAAHARYLKVRERTSYAFAVVSAAAALRIEQGAIRRGAARARRRCRQAVAGARGGSSIWPAAVPTPIAFRRAAEAALADAKPSGDNAFKIELARRIIVRALTLAAAGTPERVPALPASPFASAPGARHDA